MLYILMNFQKRQQRRSIQKSSRMPLARSNRQKQLDQSSRERRQFSASNFSFKESEYRNNYVSSSYHNQQKIRHQNGDYFQENTLQKTFRETNLKNGQRKTTLRKEKIKGQKNSLKIQQLCQQLLEHYFQYKQDLKYILRGMGVEAIGELMLWENQYKIERISLQNQKLKIQRTMGEAMIPKEGSIGSDSEATVYYSIENDEQFEKCESGEDLAHYLIRKRNAHERSQSDKFENKVHEANSINSRVNKIKHIKGNLDVQVVEFSEDQPKNNPDRNIRGQNFNQKQASKEQYISNLRTQKQKTYSMIQQKDRPYLLLSESSSSHQIRIKSQDLSLVPEIFIQEHEVDLRNSSQNQQPESSPKQVPILNTFFSEVPDYTDQQKKQSFNGNSRKIHQTDFLEARSQTSQKNISIDSKSNLNDYLKIQHKKLNDQRRRSVIIGDEMSRVCENPNHLLDNQQFKPLSSQDPKLVGFQVDQLDTNIKCIFKEIIDLSSIAEMTKFHLKNKTLQILEALQSNMFNSRYRDRHIEERNIIIGSKSFVDSGFTNQISAQQFAQMSAALMPDYKKSSISHITKMIFKSSLKLKYEDFAGKMSAFTNFLTERDAQYLNCDISSKSKHRSTRTIDFLRRLFSSWIQINFYEQKLKGLFKSNTNKFKQFLNSVTEQKSSSRQGKKVSPFLFHQFVVNDQHNIKNRQSRLRIEIYLYSILGQDFREENLIQWVYEE